MRIRISALLALAVVTAGCTDWRESEPEPLPVAAGAVTAFDADELTTRRSALAASIPGGIALIPARSAPKTMEQPGWIQRPAFYYLTGLLEGANAILAVDGPRGTSTLYVGGAPSMFGAPATAAAVPPADTVRDVTGIDAVRDWNQFVADITPRVAEGARLYVEWAGSSGGTPPDMAPVDDFDAVWSGAVESTFPEAELHDLTPVIDAIRWKKSPAEIERLRTNAAASAAALRAGMLAVRPGATQRVAESAVVSGCLLAGANGPSFWPWMQSGPNAHLTRLVNSFHVYDNLNRVMQAGELLRADIGCMGSGYGGDVGRTLPVSGQFSEDQAFVYDHLVGAYHAGIDVMRAGVPLDSVGAAATAYLQRIRDVAGSDRERELLDAMIEGVVWHIHSIGIESAEPNEPVFSDGTVIDFEPMFSHGDDAWYLEDMILVTEDGAEVLTTGLPTTAAEIEAAMSEDRPR